MVQTKLNEDNIIINDNCYWHYPNKMIIVMDKPITKGKIKVLKVIPFEEKHLYKFI